MNESCRFKMALGFNIIAFITFITNNKTLFECNILFSFTLIDLKFTRTIFYLRVICYIWNALYKINSSTQSVSRSLFFTKRFVYIKKEHGISFSEIINKKT